MHQFVEDLIRHLGVRRYFEPSNVGIARRRQSGTLDLLEVGIVVLSSTTKRRGSTALFVSSGFERNPSWLNQKMCQKRATRIPFVHIWPIWYFEKSVSYVFSVSDF